MLCCCAAGEEEQKLPDVVDLQQKPVLETAIEAQLVKAIETAPEVKKEVKKEPEAPAFGSFSVIIPVEGHSSLGLEVDRASELGPMIKEVKPGAAQAFNEAHPLTALKPFDIIASLGGVKNTDEIFEKMKDDKIAGDMSMTMLRPRRIEIPLTKTESLGLKLDFGALSVGAVVRELGKGLVATWNAKNSALAVGENDRVIEVNGAQHLGEQLVAAFQALGKDEKFTITVLKY